MVSRCHLKRGGLETSRAPTRSRKPPCSGPSGHRCRRCLANKHPWQHEAGPYIASMILHAANWGNLDSPKCPDILVGLNSQSAPACAYYRSNQVNTCTKGKNLIYPAVGPTHGYMAQPLDRVAASCIHWYASDQRNCPSWRNAPLSRPAQIR